MKILGDVTSIPSKAFQNDRSLQIVSLPNTVTNIEQYAFNGCTALEKVENTDNVEKMGIGAFSGCKALKVASFPKLKAFNTNVFSGCSELTTVDMSSATGIASGAFGYCYSLSSITIPSTVTSINSSAFTNCYMTADNIKNSSSRNPNITIADVEQADGLVIKDTVAVMCRRWATAVNIPNTVNKIDAFAFYDCSKLVSVSLPNTLSRISMNTFGNCESLQSIDIPESVTSIDYAFRNCPALKTVTFHEGLESIANSFNTCGAIENLTIPSTVNSISSCFKELVSLKSVTLMSKNLPTVSDKSFYGGNAANATLWVDENLVESCETTDPWSMFGDIKELPSHRNFTITAAGMATSCSDRDLDFSGRDDVKAYIASGFNPTTGKVLMTRVWEIPAGTGFIIRGNEGSYELPTTTTGYVYANLLVGTLADTEVPKTDGTYDNYILGNGDNGVGFYLSEGGNMKANKAYLHIPTSVAASKKSIKLSFEDEGDTTTGFISVKDLAAGKQGNTVIYNLVGQRIQGVSKGINIVNGKKVLVK